MYRTIRYLHSQHGISRIVSVAFATYEEADAALNELPGYIEQWVDGPGWVGCDE